MASATEAAEPVTIRSVLDALEADYPVLRGTIRDQDSKAALAAAEAGANLALLVVFLGFWMFTDPSGLAVAGKEGGSAAWGLLAYALSGGGSMGLGAVAGPSAEIAQRAARTALAIDRRALLVSALAYVLYALTSLFEQAGAVELSFAITALIIGSALLLLSAFWHTARRGVVNTLPAALQSKLPVVDRAAVTVA